MISPEVLRRFPYFSGISEYSLKQIAMISEEMDVDSGHEIFADGDTLHHLYIITKGEVDILCVFESGERKVVDTLVPGEVAAWSAVVEPYRATATGVATKPASLIAIHASSLRSLIDKDHTLGYRVMSEVAKAVSHRLAGARIQLAALS